MEPSQQEISPADIHLGPSTQNTIITKSGLIFDIAPEKIIALWDPSTGRCISASHKILSSINSYFYSTLLLHDSEKVLIVTDASFYIFSLKEEILIKHIRTETRFDKVALHHEVNKVVGIIPGYIQLWDLEKGFMIRYLYTGIDSKEKNFKRLEPGPFIIYSEIKVNLEKAIYIVDAELSKVRKIPIKGFLFCVACSKDYTYALGKKNSIKVFKGESQINANCSLKGFHEKILSLAFVSTSKIERLVSGSNKGTIRIWDYKLRKCLKIIGGTKDDLDVNINLLLYVPGKQYLLSSIYEKKVLKVWEINQEGNDLKPLRSLEGNIVRVEKILVLEKKFLAILCFAQYHERICVFLQEIRVICLETGKVLAKKQQENFRLIEAKSMMCVYDSRILYLAKTNSPTLNQNHELHIWDYRMNYENTYSFSVDNPNGAIFYKFNRILVPYCLSISEKNIFMKGPSGISIYDFSVRLVWKNDFDFETLKNAIDMIDENRLVFINKKNQMEIWNIKKKEPPIIIETSPNVFTKIIFIKNFYFLTSNKEFLVMENKYLDCVYKRKRDQGKNIVQIEYLKENTAVILFSDGSLEKADMEKLIFTAFELDFRAKNFVVFDENNIYVSGEAIIKKINLTHNY